MNDDSLPEKTRASLRGRFAPQESARAWIFDRSSERRRRADLRQRQADAALAESREAQALLQAEATLRGAPAALPQNAQTPKTQKARKAKKA